MRLSIRAQSLVNQSSKSVLDQALGKTFSDQYASNNETGVINMGLAENSLMHDYLTSFYEKNLKLLPTDFTYGTSLVGSTRLFSALPPFYASYIHPLIPLEPSHIACANGVTALLDQLALVTCDPGEAWIVPQPYYNSFEADLKDRGLVELVGVEVPEWEWGEMAEVEALEMEMQKRAKEGGAKVRVVLISNPNNPLGFCYSSKVLLAYARFAEKWDLLLVSDEIYATSVYKSDLPNARAFTSFLSLDVREQAGCDPSRIVQLYGMSKDFGANGFRVGVLVAQHNLILHSALMATAWPIKLSSVPDALWSSLLTSDELPRYIATNQARLAEAYELATTWLREHKIEYQRANAGHFIAIDLRPYLSSQDLEGEVELLNRLVEAGVYLGPGFSYKMNRKGFFRLTFSIERKQLLLGLERIERVLYEVRTQ